MWYQPKCIILCESVSDLPFSLASRPRVKDEDVKQLSEMFPTLEKDVITSVLEASNGQVDSAVTNLLQMTEAQ